MAWIESHQSLRNHPKLTRLCNELKICRAQGIGHLHIFWWWCIDYASTGSLSKYTALQIADGADWDGDPEQFVEAMKAAGFLDELHGGLSVHDWLDFCGELVKQRCRRLEQKRRGVRDLVAPNPRHPTEPTKQDQTEHNQPSLTGFASFWALYPRKRSKGEAEKAWIKLNPSQELQDRILDALQRATTSDQWTKDGGQFIPYPGTWLNAQGWEDDYSPSVAVSVQTAGIQAFLQRGDA
jgi:hypothetical protein